MILSVTPIEIEARRDCWVPVDCTSGGLAFSWLWEGLSTMAPMFVA